MDIDRGQRGLASRAAPLVLALLLVVSFLGLNRGLWTPDEPREAEISREMLLAPGIIPHLNGAPFVEKPPLYYWMVAGAYRLAGEPSPAAARAVSAIAGFLTLLLVFLWGRRAHSTAVGLIASCMLATSVQFMLTAHWILIDPVLMLFTTAAAWAAWELLRGNGGRLTAGLLYAALALALWSKGLIGPVLIGAGLAADAVIERRWPWRPLRLGIGVAIMVTALLVLSAAIYQAGGMPALRQWAWVNHVERFLHPEHTGHEQPLPYYLWTLPFAILPWLVPVADAFRPARWRRASAGSGLRRYCTAMAGGMLVVLTAAATKRGIYLMPVLPIIFLGLAVNVHEWLQDRTQASGLGRWWLAQAILLGVIAVGPPLAAMGYLRRPDFLAIVFLLLAVAACAGLFAAFRRRSAEQGLAAMAATALVAAGAMLALAPRILDAEKNMGPFFTALDQQLPPGAPVSAINADETLLAIVPFVTGRHVAAIDTAGLDTLRANAASRPRYLLVQTKLKKVSPPDLGAGYVLVETRDFGPGRNLALWRLGPDAAPRVVVGQLQDAG